MKASIYKLLLLTPLVITSICHNYFLLDVQSFELCYSLLLIFTLGIPHGAMDHIIFKKERKEISHLFTLLYWTLGIGNAVLWFYFPLEVTFFFIVISAFHFGEAQFSSSKILSKRPVFLICWGMAVITLLLSKNVDQLAHYVEYYNNPAFYQNVLYFLENGTVFLVFLTLTIVFKLYFLLSRKIKTDIFLRQSLFFIFLMVFMNFSTTLVGITAFFVFVHSWSVLEQEYDYLKKDNPSFSLFDFVKVIFPFSILSYLMVGLFFALSIFGVVQISNAYLVIVILSSLTLPHAVVMHIFYNNAKSVR
ncbi:MAG: Brp/Blh family beta-carotene 15,15'-dioxygenase [Bacteroidota bacterium]